MYSAIYYPHMEIKNSAIIKTALLLWDELRYIAPSDDFGQYSTDADTQEALELIAKPLIPSDDDKRLAHNGILELVTSDLPNEFLLENCPEDSRYMIYPMKFLPETWDALAETKLARLSEGANLPNWGMDRSIGLAMMALLAESCAGSTFRTITDKKTPYSVLSHVVTGLHGGDMGNKTENASRLVTLSLKVASASDISLRTLLDFRKRESGAGGVRISELRHNYLDKIDTFASRLASGEYSEASRLEIERQFEQEMRGDLGNLKEALKIRATDFLLSKEVGVAILCAAGVMLPPLTVPAGLLAVGALVKKGLNYRESRFNAMKTHTTAWLHELEQHTDARHGR